MPRSSIILTDAAVTLVDIASSIRDVWQSIRLLDDDLEEFEIRELYAGGAVQIAIGGSVVATISVSRPITTPELRRLLPETTLHARAWTEVLTPTNAAGHWGALLTERIATECDGTVVMR